MIKIGIGSIYFAARNAGSPATLTITFGDPSQAYDGEFTLVINGTQHFISFGDENVSNVGTYDLEGEEIFLGYGSTIANYFYNYIVNNFSSSLTISIPSGPNASTVTLATKAKGPTASLNAACTLPLFPDVPLTGLSEISKFSFAGLLPSDLANGSGPGKYLTIGDASGNNHYFWWRSNIESDPLPVGIGHRIDYSVGDDIYQLAQALIVAAQATTLWVGDLDFEAETATLTTVAGGNVINASAGTTPVAVTTVKQGINITPTLVNAVFVSGAGTEEANGLYIPNGTIGGRTTYFNTNASGIYIFWDNVYNIYRILVSDLLYYTSNSPANPWNGIYLTYEGSDPVPTVRQATSADL